jgi:hypothetical protein
VFLFVKRPTAATIIKVIAAVFGGWLMIRVIRGIGWQQVSETFREHYYLLILITVAYTTYHVLRTYTLRVCIPHSSHFGSIFGIRLAGEAISYIAIGSVVGDTLKVALARKTIPVVEGATGVFAEKLIYHLAGSGFIIAGLFLAVLRFGAHPFLVYLLFAMVLVFSVLLFLLSSGRKPIARILRNVRVRKPRLREAVLRTEERLFQFRAHYPAQFAIALAVNFLTYMYSTTELMVILRVLGLQPSFWDIWYYEAVIKIANMANVIVPGNLGIFELTNTYLARQLAMGEHAGIMVALFIRTRAIMWAVIGYLWFLFLLARRGTVTSE